jgi:hypothetical protein
LLRAIDCATPGPWRQGQSVCPNCVRLNSRRCFPHLRDRDDVRFRGDHLPPGATEVVKVFRMPTIAGRASGDGVGVRNPSPSQLSSQLGPRLQSRHAGDRCSRRASALLGRLGAIRRQCPGDQGTGPSVKDARGLYESTVGLCCSRPRPASHRASIGLHRNQHQRHARDLMPRTPLPIDGATVGNTDVDRIVAVRSRVAQAHTAGAAATADDTLQQCIAFARYTRPARIVSIEVVHQLPAVRHELIPVDISRMSVLSRRSSRISPRAFGKCPAVCPRRSL